MNKFFTVFGIVLGVFLVNTGQSWAFADLPAEAYCQTPARYFAELGIIKKTEQNKFLPQKTVNRAEGLKIILAAAGEIPPLSQEGDFIFVDTPKNAWFTPWVLHGVNIGAVGMPNSDQATFSPAQPLTEAAFMKMTLETFGVNPSEYALISAPNVPDNAWFKPYADFFVHYGIIITPNPERNLTRCQTVELLYRLMNRGKGIQAEVSNKVGMKIVSTMEDFLQKQNIVAAKGYIPHVTRAMGEKQTFQTLEQAFSAYLDQNYKASEQLAKQVWAQNQNQSELEQKMQNIAHMVAKMARLKQ